MIDSDRMVAQHQDGAPRQGGPGQPDRSPRQDWEIGVNLVRVRRVLLIALAVIVTLDVLASIGAAVGAPYFLTRFFDGDEKLNFPTGWKTTFLLADALLLTAHAWLARWTGDRFIKGWKLLAFTTFFAFIDETTYLHQSLAELIEKHFNTSGPLEFAWTIVYIPMAIAVGLTLLRHIRHLAPAVRYRLLVGGALYTVGAICFEPIKSEVSEGGGDGSMLFKLVAATSDSLEMIGLTVLCLVLLSELARRTSGIRIGFTRAATADQNASSSGRHVSP